MCVLHELWYDKQDNDRVHRDTTGTLFGGERIESLGLTVFGLQDLRGVGFRLQGVGPKSCGVKGIGLQGLSLSMLCECGIHFLVIIPR